MERIYRIFLIILSILCIHVNEQDLAGRSKCRPRPGSVPVSSPGFLVHFPCASLGAFWWVLVGSSPRMDANEREWERDRGRGPRSGLFTVLGLRVEETQLTWPVGLCYILPHQC